MSKGTLVISNMEVGDDTFECDKGSWNISRAVRDCKKGKHRKYHFNVDDVYRNNANVEVDEAKVAEFVAKKLKDFPPLIFAFEDGALWLIEGHHRMHALHRLNMRDCVGYVIEEEDAAPYKIYYNGNRVAPWRS